MKRGKWARGLACLAFLMMAGRMWAQQTATLHLLGKLHEEDFYAYEQLEFMLNGVRFTGLDTGVLVFPVHEHTLDTFVIRHGHNVLVSSAQFLPGEAYELKAGCCCGLVSLAPVGHCQRGWVRFDNRSDSLLVMSHSLETDTLGGGQQSAYTLSIESAMCLCKPADLSARTWVPGTTGSGAEGRPADPETYWFLGHFLFLHGEMITVSTSRSGEIHVRLDGYAPAGWKHELIPPKPRPR